MTTQTIQQNINPNFILLSAEGVEQQAFMGEVGTLVFQSALMKYLAIETDDVVHEFEAFINLRVGSEEFIADLCQKYPLFGEMLNDEMMAFQLELDSLS